MTTRHKPIEEAAAEICGERMKNPVLWTRRRIRTGQFRALKVGREIRMTEKQIEDAIASLEIGSRPDAEQPQRRMGITAASMRRRSA